MKYFFHGKKSFVTIPFAILLGLAFLPFTIGIGLMYLSWKKISNQKIKLASVVIIGLFTLFTSNAWVAGMSSSSLPKKEIAKEAIQQEQKIEVDKNKPQATKPIEIELTPTPTFQPQTAPANKNIVLAKVVRVIDGDTIEVDLGNNNIQKVRYIGIDTPETVDPRKTVQCFGKEASSKNKELVENNTVGLEKDVSETDKYGRLLRYVYAGDLFINQLLVNEGYAYASSYPPDIKYQDKFTEAQRQAQASNRGLWSACVSAQSPTSKPVTGTTSTSTCKYSCSSPDRDCSDFTTHSEAQAFFNCCGFTATNDPMKLDSVGVGDGIACESLP